MHFVDLASAAEKMRWAEKEWRELDQELVAEAEEQSEETDENDASEPQQMAEAGSFRSA